LAFHRLPFVLVAPFANVSPETVAQCMYQHDDRYALLSAWEFSSG
jgi:hypothetical protein